MIAPSSAIEEYSNPVRLSVATRETSATRHANNANAEAGPSRLSERETSLKAKKRNEEVRRKGERWADKLMEETVDRDTFKRALRYIHPSQYDLITHERHLNSLCSYPLCSHPPAAPFKPGKRFRISTTNRTITEVEGNKEDGFCSKACTIRSRWVYERLEQAGSVLARGKDWTIELVEDLDLSTRPSERHNPIKRQHLPVSQEVPAGAEVGAGSASRNSTRLPSPTVPDAQVPVDLIGNLHIHERPTAPSERALPPSAATATTNSTSRPAFIPPPSLTPPSKRAPNAILGEQSKLAQTVLKASKAINPEPQINPDSDDEGEHAEVEWEREVGLDWGGGSDGEEDVWAAMRQAREMSEER